MRIQSRYHSAMDYDHGRFFKTRSLAAQAVDGGKVWVNGNRTKPARELRPGDKLAIRIGEIEWVVSVRGLSSQRRPAPEARMLYEETPESLERRMRALAEREAQAVRGRGERGRPTKRDRRMIHRFTDA
jgi:ribosome-associated heat shock protein Hsp15